MQDRDYNDYYYELVGKAASSIQKKYNSSCTIQGKTRGVDHLGKNRAIFNDVQHEDCPSWKNYGKMAEPIRNARMLVEGKPDLVIAFPDRRGGAANMIKIVKTTKSSRT